MGDTAKVSINRTGNYWFNIDSNNDGTFGKKTANHASNRYAEFVRNSVGEWSLSKISLCKINMKNASLDAFSILKVDILSSGKTVWSNANPSQLLDISTDLSKFSPGQLVQIKAFVSGGENNVFLHNRVFEGVEHRRYIMTEESQSSGNKNVLRSMTAPTRPGYYQLAIDVINSATFEDDLTDNYKSDILIIPYEAE